MCSYKYVKGNPVRWVDPNGQQAATARVIERAAEEARKEVALRVIQGGANTTVTEATTATTARTAASAGGWLLRGLSRVFGVVSFLLIPTEFSSNDTLYNTPSMEKLSDIRNSVVTAIQTNEAERNSNNRRGPTIIYRMGSGTNTNLTPRVIDTTGLSFTLVRPISGNYVATTIEAVNATGALKAQIDSGNHVSVMPTNPLNMSSWISSRPTAETNPHPFTQILQAITVKIRQR